jgi:hypothetical protein
VKKRNVRLFHVAETSLHQLAEDAHTFAINADDLTVDGVFNSTFSDSVTLRKRAG